MSDGFNSVPTWPQATFDARECNKHQTRSRQPLQNSWHTPLLQSNLLPQTQRQKSKLCAQEKEQQRCSEVPLDLINRLGRSAPSAFRLHHQEWHHNHKLSKRQVHSRYQKLKKYKKESSSLNTNQFFKGHHMHISIRTSTSGRPNPFVSE